MGIRTIDQVLKMGIVDEVLTDFLEDLRELSDTTFETMGELSDSLSESTAYSSFVSALSESTDGECASKLSKSQTRKYARMFPKEYRAVRVWAIRRVNAESYAKRVRSRYAKKRAQRRVDFTEARLEKALEVFSKKVNEAKAAGK